MKKLLVRFDVKNLATAPNGLPIVSTSAPDDSGETHEHQFYGDPALCKAVVSENGSNVGWLCVEECRVVIRPAHQFSRWIEDGKICVKNGDSFYRTSAVVDNVEEVVADIVLFHEEMTLSEFLKKYGPPLAHAWKKWTASNEGRVFDRLFKIF